jgi:hypothetical protein
MNYSTCEGCSEMRPNLRMSEGQSLRPDQGGHDLGPQESQETRVAMIRYLTERCKRKVALEGGNATSQRHSRRNRPIGMDVNIQHKFL